MSNQSFEIFFRKMYDKNQYRAMVEITHQSENVLRFTITAGKKEMKMEKLLFRKNNQWKITGISFPMMSTDKTNAMMLMDIQKAIDANLKSLGI